MNKIKYFLRYLKKRMEYFFHYLESLKQPVHDTNIWSVDLAWHCAEIAAEHRKINDEYEKALS